jgi:hypothetical protein
MSDTTNQIKELAEYAEKAGALLVLKQLWGQSLDMDFETVDVDKLAEAVAEKITELEKELGL